jgi:large subunit ribosomal protein L11
MAAKDVKRIVNILAYSGIARPTAKLGQALGPLGLNMAQICKEFNEMTQTIRPDVPMKATLSAFFDKTYKLEIRGPPLTWMIKRASGTLKGSPSPFFENAGLISIYSVYDIANLKKNMDPAFKHISLQSVCSVRST